MQVSCICRDARPGKSSRADPAIEYPHRSGRLNSFSDIGQLARISRRTAAPNQRDIRKAGAIHRPSLRLTFYLNERVSLRIALVGSILTVVTGCGTMIQEISQRIYGTAVVCLWVVVVSGTAAIIWASTVNGGINW
jgi:hypothetical protein